MESRVLVIGTVSPCEMWLHHFWSCAVAGENTPRRDGWHLGLALSLQRPVDGRKHDNRNRQLSVPPRLSCWGDVARWWSYQQQQPQRLDNLYSSVVFSICVRFLEPEPTGDRQTFPGDRMGHFQSSFPHPPLCSLLFSPASLACTSQQYVTLCFPTEKLFCQCLFITSCQNVVTL